MEIGIYLALVADLIERLHNAQEDPSAMRTGDDMFESSLIESTTHRVKTNTKWYSLATMIVYSTVFLTVIVAEIMLANPEFQEQILGASLLAPPPPPPPPPPAPPQAPPSIPRNVIKVPAGFVAPTVTPKELPPETPNLPIVEVAPGTMGVTGGVPGGVPGGVLGGVVGGVLGGTGAAPPPPEKKPAPPKKPRRVSGGVLKGNAIRKPAPVYPAIARSARVQGSVQIEVVIDETGSVVEARIVNGHPLLRQSALDAARQWKFRPTLLSGQPIKITGILVFNFRM